MPDFPDEIILRPERGLWRFCAATQLFGLVFVVGVILPQVLKNGHIFDQLLMGFLLIALGTTSVALLSASFGKFGVLIISKEGIRTWNVWYQEKFFSWNTIRGLKVFSRQYFEQIYISEEHTNHATRSKTLTVCSYPKLSSMDLIALIEDYKNRTLNGKP